MSKYIKLKDLIDTDCILVDEIECDDCPFYDKERFWCRMIDWIRSLPTIEVSEDAISREYIKTLFENNLTGTCKDVVVHTIENAPSVVPTTEPQTDCEGCEHWKYIAHEWQCETEKCQKKG